MARYLSLYRRKPNLVDLNLRARANAASYQFQAAQNFDGVFGTFQVVPASGGFRSKSAPDTGFDGEQFRGLTRFKFAPSDYSAPVTDSSPFYVKIIQTDVDGTVHPAEAMHLILPYDPMPNRPLVLVGVAPSAVGISGSYEIQLPMQTQNIQIQNNGAVPLMVAFEPSGPEFTVYPLSTEFTNFYSTYPSVTQIFVRGSGGTCAFQLIGDLRNNPLT